MECLYPKRPKLPVAYWLNCSHSNGVMFGCFVKAPGVSHIGVRYPLMMVLLDAKGEC